jgi:hypothetical protein
MTTARKITRMTTIRWRQPLLITASNGDATHNTRWTAEIPAYLKKGDNITAGAIAPLP